MVQLARVRRSKPSRPAVDEVVKRTNRKAHQRPRRLNQRYPRCEGLTGLWAGRQREGCDARRAAGHWHEHEGGLVPAEPILLERVAVPERVASSLVAVAAGGDTQAKLRLACAVTSKAGRGLPQASVGVAAATVMRRVAWPSRRAHRSPPRRSSSPERTDGAAPVMASRSASVIPAKFCWAAWNSLAFRACEVRATASRRFASVRRPTSWWCACWSLARPGEAAGNSTPARRRSSSAAGGRASAGLYRHSSTSAASVTGTPSTRGGTSWRCCSSPAPSATAQAPHRVASSRTSWYPALWSPPRSARCRSLPGASDPRGGGYSRA